MRSLSSSEEQEVLDVPTTRRPRRCVEQPVNYYKEQYDLDDDEEEAGDGEQDQEANGNNNNGDDEWKEPVPKRKRRKRLDDEEEEGEWEDNDEEETHDPDDDWSAAESNENDDEELEADSEPEEEEHPKKRSSKRAKLSDYERLRLKNVERNKERLKSLGLLDETKKKRTKRSRSPKPVDSNGAAAATTAAEPERKSGRSKKQVNYNEEEDVTLSDEEEEGVEESNEESQDKDYDGLDIPTDFEPTIGMKIEKDFGGTMYYGHVSSGPETITSDKGQTSLEWTILYDDGDQEDMNKQEIYQYHIKNNSDSSRIEEKKDEDPSNVEDDVDVSSARDESVATRTGLALGVE